MKDHKVAVAMLPILVIIGLLARLFIGVRSIGIGIFVIFCMDVMYLLFFTNALQINWRRKNKNQ